MVEIQETINAIYSNKTVRVHTSFEQNVLSTNDFHRFPKVCFCAKINPQNCSMGNLCKFSSQKRKSISVKNPSQKSKSISIQNPSQITESKSIGNSSAKSGSMYIKRRLSAQIENATFIKIVYFWFRTTISSKLVNRINIDDIIQFMYNYYHIEILLRYYDYKASGSQFQRDFQSSCLWLVESNGKIYFVDNCHDLRRTMEINDNSDTDEYAVDKYLHSEYLSQKQCQRLIEILVDLQISLQYNYSECVEASVFNHRIVVSHIGKQICLPKQHKNYEDEAEINTEPLMEFMSDVIGISTSTLYQMERVRTEKIDTPYHTQNVRINKEKNVLYFNDHSIYDKGRQSLLAIWKTGGI